MDRETILRGLGADARNEGAWEGYMRVVYPRMIALLVRKGVPEGEAEEIAQEATFRLFQRVATRPGSFDPGNPGMGAYPLAIAINLHRKAARRRRVWDRHKEAYALRQAAARRARAPGEDSEEGRREIMQALRGVPPEVSQVGMLRLIEGRSEADAARALGVSTATVHGRARRFRMGMRRALQQPRE